MKKLTLLFMAGCVFAVGRVHAGYVYTGGSVSGHVDDRGFYAEVSPVIGYRYNILDVGLGAFYSYTDRYDRVRYTYGARTYLQMTLLKNVFAHGEVQLTNIGSPRDQDDRKWVVSFPVGAGYRQNLDPKTQAYAMILYDLALDKNSPVRNPIFRAGVTRRF